MADKASMDIARMGCMTNPTGDALNEASHCTLLISRKNSMVKESFTNSIKLLKSCMNGFDFIVTARVAFNADNIAWMYSNR